MKTRVALPLDLLLVTLFAVIGRASHAEAFDLFGLWNTAWPFLVGTMAGWQASRGWRAPGSLRTGIIVWTGAVVVGMFLRVFLADQGTAVTFIVVTAITLGLFLIGWRLLWAAIERRRPAVTPAAVPRPNPQQKRR